MKSAISIFLCASFVFVGTFLGAISVQPAHAQDLKASSQELVSEEKWMGVYYDLEITMRELMWYQSMLVLAFYVENNSDVNTDGSTNNANELLDFKDRIGWTRSGLGSFKRALRRGKELPAEDLARAQEVVELYGKFLAAAENVAALLGESETRAANLVFQENSVPLSDKIGVSLFTLRRAAQDRFRDHAKNVR